jgi:hypothetical protein
MILPEEVINNYPFETNNDNLKLYLINYYNLMTLRNYKETGQFYTEQEILIKMPNKIIEFYTNNVEKQEMKDIKCDKKKGFWTDDKVLVDKLDTFIKTKYNVSSTPDVKFKDLMTEFSKYTGMDLPNTWSVKYESICTEMDIKWEKVIDPRYIGKGNGTCYLFLTPKNDTVITNKKITNLFPLIPEIPIPKSKPMIPIIPKLV